MKSKVMNGKESAIYHFKRVGFTCLISLQVRRQKPQDTNKAPVPVFSAFGTERWTQRDGCGANGTTAGIWTYFRNWYDQVVAPLHVSYDLQSVLTEHLTTPCRVSSAGEKREKGGRTSRPGGFFLVLILA